MDPVKIPINSGNIQRYRDSSTSLDNIYRQVVLGESPPSRTSKIEIPVSDNPLRSEIKRYSAASTDSAIGTGHFISRLSESLILRKIAPPIQSINAGIGRAVGGAISLVTSGYRVYHSVKDDLASGDRSFYQTRREVTASLGSMASAMIIGELGYIGTAAVASLGAPVGVTTGLAVGTAFLAGYGAYKIRNFVDDRFLKVGNAPL